jgi:hypothetical protein
LGIDFFLILKYLYLNKNTKKKTMKKIVKLTETDLTRLVKRTINEMDYMDDEGMSFEEYRDTLEDMMGEFYDAFDLMSNDYLVGTSEMYEDIEDNESLDKDDKYDLLDQITEFQNDLGSLLEKYYQFFRKKGRR